MEVPGIWVAAAVTAIVALLVLYIATVRWLLWRLRSARFDARSQSTRYGQITEQFAPFMADWPWDPRQFRFLGSPVDGVQFNEDGVVFVEIKAAGGRLNAVQQQVKGHVEAGRVSWREVRIR